MRNWQKAQEKIARESEALNLRHLRGGTWRHRRESRSARAMLDEGSPTSSRPPLARFVEIWQSISCCNVLQCAAMCCNVLHAQWHCLASLRKSKKSGAAPSSRHHLFTVPASCSRTRRHPKMLLPAYVYTCTCESIFGASNRLIPFKPVAMVAEVAVCWNIHRVGT